MKYKDFTDLVEEISKEKNITLDEAFQLLIRAMIGISLKTVTLIKEAMK